MSLVPNYFTKLTLYGCKWSISQPITLYGSKQSELDTKRVKLTPGIYKIKYTLSTVTDDTIGLGIIHSGTNKLTTILHRQIKTSYKSISNISSSVYINIEEDSNLALISKTGEITPEKLIGGYVVNILKRSSEVPE